MTTNGKQPADWRTARAAHLEASVAAVELGLDRLDDLAALLAGDTKLTTEIHSLAALLRGRRNDWREEVGALRADTAEARR
jgi:hypothetical protein